MKTVFKVGMKVYDNIFFPNSKGEVVRIDEHYDCERVIVRFDNWDYDASYTEKGRLVATYKGATPTLSTKPYTLQGFEQKAPAPTFEKAWEEAERVYEPKNEYDKEEFGGYPSQELADASEALRRLLFLRDYYNKGWQPDWSKKNKMHFCIRVRNNKITTNSDSDINEFNTVLVFRDYTIRDKFLEEQKELLEIAKPLL